MTQRPFLEIICVNEIKWQCREYNREEKRCFLIRVKLLDFLNIPIVSLWDTVFLANVPYIVIDCSVPYQLRLTLNLQTFPSKPGGLFTRIRFFDQQLVTALRKTCLTPPTPHIISPHVAVCVSVSITGAICSEDTGRDAMAPQRLRYPREAPGTCRAQVFSKITICS